MRGRIFVISGSSGSGKTTLLRKLLEVEPNLRFSISYTTRAPRPDERHGREYFFISEDEFQALIRQGALAEWVKVFGHYYGSSREWIDQALGRAQELIFDLEIHGANALKSHYPEASCIFILPPSPQELAFRLRQRGDVPEEELQQRLDRVREEIAQISWYDYLVVNDDILQALFKLQAIVTATRCRTSALWPQIHSSFEV
jgi:guanylate kinase